MYTINVDCFNTPLPWLLWWILGLMWPLPWNSSLRNLFLLAFCLSGLPFQIIIKEYIKHKLQVNS